jgi:hypothetical protein
LNCLHFEIFIQNNDRAHWGYKQEDSYLPCERLFMGSSMRAGLAYSLIFALRKMGDSRVIDDIVSSVDAEEKIKKLMFQIFKPQFLVPNRVVVTQGNHRER